MQRSTGEWRPAGSPRGGVTLLEVLVVIFVMGLLLALLLPAVLSTRGASRRIECTSRLKQVGLAVASYADDFGVLPAQYPTGYRDGSLKRLFPYLGLPSSFDPTVEGSLAVLQCPADELAVSSLGHMSYDFCQGSGFSLVNAGVLPTLKESVALRDVRDGLSNTAFVSERLVTFHEAHPRDTMHPPGVEDAAAQRAPERFLWYIPRSHRVHDWEGFVDDCHNRRTTIHPVLHQRVSEWDWRSFYGYNHVLTPNAPACYDGPPGTTMAEINSIDMANAFFFGSRPPSSHHPGGVEVLFGDGSVRFVSDGIDGVVWRAAGTIAAGDVSSGVGL